MNKIVVASNNQGKVNEICSLLDDLPIDIVPQSQWQVEDAVESGFTFVENALIKARHACHQTQLPAIADDSGIEVAALNGKPGIYSARFAGESASDQDNIAKLLQVLQNSPRDERHACYRCVIVYLRHEFDPMPLICQGSWHGVIADEPAGDKGFGYDPIFYDEQQGCTAAQLDSQIKNQISHRGLALQQLQEYLSKIEFEVSEEKR